MHSVLIWLCIGRVLGSRHIVAEECPNLSATDFEIFLKFETNVQSSQKNFWVSGEFDSEVFAGLEEFLAVRSVDHSVCPEWIARHILRLADMSAGTERERLLVLLANLFRLVSVRNWYRKILFDFDNFGVSLEGRRAPHTRLFLEIGNRAEILFWKYAQPRLPIRGDGFVGNVLIHSICVYPVGTELVNLAMRNHLKYAQFHNYEYSTTREAPEEYLENPQFYKTKYIADWAREKGVANTLLLIDCDAFFTNLHTSVESIMAAYGAATDGQFLYVAEDNGGINTGVLIAGKSEWTAKFFEAANRNYHMAMAWDQSMVYFEILKRAGIFETTVDYPPKKVFLVHQGDLNAYHEGTAKSWNTYAWTSGDFVIHFAGCPQEEAFCLNLMKLASETLYLIRFFCLPYKHAKYL